MAVSLIPLGFLPPLVRPSRRHVARHALRLEVEQAGPYALASLSTR